MKTVTTLFLDVGGVLLSNGWGHESRKAAAHFFELDYNEMEALHKITMGTYEEGKLTLKEYLYLIVFYKKRKFTFSQFREFMFSRTTANVEMLELMRQLKEKFQLKIGVVNNEARELNEYRIRKFKLNQFVDFYISSCVVQIRKPDKDIFRMALDIASVPAKNVVFIDNMQMFVDVAENLGIRGIQHKDYLTTKKTLATMGLEI